MLALFSLQIAGQVSVVVLMGTDHDQFKMASDKTIGEKILRCMHLELVDEDAPEIPLFLLSDGGGL